MRLPMIPDQPPSFPKRGGLRFGAPEWQGKSYITRVKGVLEKGAKALEVLCGLVALCA